MSNAIIKQDQFVSLVYTITDNAGEVLERIDSPIEYIHGRDSQVIKKVEIALEGKKQGDVVKVSLSAEDGFGEYQEELTFTDELDNVPAQFHQIGAEVEFQNDYGETRIFRVVKIEGDKLTVDGNHPFAGKTIIYNIEVSEIREATAEELENCNSSASMLH